MSRLGATPVFVDIDPVTFNVDPVALAAALTPRTKAILPVHLYGLCANMDAILALGAKAGVPVIEDAAQAIDAQDHGRTAGAMGAAGCFSFFPSKNLGAFGDGGFITTNDAPTREGTRAPAQSRRRAEVYHARIGGNFRLDALQAAVLRVKLPHLDGWTEARRRNADRYRALFAESGVDAVVTLPTEPAGFHHIYNQFVILGPRRDALRTHLASRRDPDRDLLPGPLSQAGVLRRRTDRPRGVPARGSRR